MRLKFFGHPFEAANPTPPAITGIPNSNMRKKASAISIRVVFTSAPSVADGAEHTAARYQT